MAPPLHKAIQDPKSFSELVDSYIKGCLVVDDKGKDKLITVVGLALAAGCDKDSICRWSKPDALLGHDPKRLIYGAIKRAKAESEQQLAQDCYRNKNAMSLALAKCMHGYVEEQHTIKHEHTHKGGISISIDTGVPNRLTRTS